MDKNAIAGIYKKVIEPNLKNWVVFEHGTCVIIYHSKEDLENEAKEVLQKYGLPTPGTPSADFEVMKLQGLAGWIVSGNQPGILNYVSEDEGEDKEDYEIGLIGRNKKEQDLKELKIIYIERAS
ncbi:hypothetical protein HYW44_04880 [Candidatus Daviesbacteria bacterium]|nr:hypothetical protein [Candidatus Daviesbacteria bacterium]